LRIGDILQGNFMQLYWEHLDYHLDILKNYNFNFDLKVFEEGWFEGIELLRTFRIENTEYLINDLIANGKKVLAEGAQGTMLDLDFGSYPFVTSSNTISAGACTGLGVSPKRIGEVFGIFKAYCTRVGSGPFPTELCDTTGELLREKGCEYGATTGRPRRCGWLDLPALKYAIMINGVTKLFMTKSDVLSGLDKIRVCKSYLIDNMECSEILFNNNARIEPVYLDFEGWDKDISEIRNYGDLPGSLKYYIEYIEEQTGVPITMVSVGPDRTETIFR
jgi:adenylosuccinate synthase